MLVCFDGDGHVHRGAMALQNAGIDAKKVHRQGIKYMVAFCSSCGSALSDGVSFCPACGAKVGGQAGAQALPAASVPTEVAAPTVPAYVNVSHQNAAAQTRLNRNDARVRPAYIPIVATILCLLIGPTDLPLGNFVTSHGLHGVGIGSVRITVYIAFLLIAAALGIVASIWAFRFPHVANKVIGLIGGLLCLFGLISVIY